MKRLEILIALSLVIMGASILNAQSQWENPVKKSLREGKPVIGMTVSVPNADVVVQAARMGFDFVWIEMEHSPITLESARNMILATKGEKLVPLVRVPVNEKWTAKRAMDAGALGVVFPFTNNVALAKQAVQACKYPPLGDRGSGPGLPTLRWPAPGGYADFADSNIMVIVIIERKEAIEQIDQIAAVPGIDVLFIGHNDLSYSYGKRGNIRDPEVLAAAAKVLAAGKKYNVPVGRTATAADIAGSLKEGYLFLQGPSELSLMLAGSRPLMEAAGRPAVDLTNRPMY